MMSTNVSTLIIFCGISFSLLSWVDCEENSLDPDDQTITTTIFPNETGLLHYASPQKQLTNVSVISEESQALLQSTNDLATKFYSRTTVPENRFDDYQHGLFGNTSTDFNQYVFLV